VAGGVGSVFLPAPYPVKARTKENWNFSDMALRRAGAAVLAEFTANPSRNSR
jgi:hypothetical protein